VSPLSHLLKSTQIHLGLTTSLSNAAQLHSAFSETTAFNVPLHSSGTPQLEDAAHAQLIIFTTQLQRNAIAQFHVMPQEPTMQLQDNVNAQLTKKVPEESGVMLTNHANVHLISHCGTESIASSVQLEPPSIPRNINATTAQMDSLEMKKATPVFQDFEIDPFIRLFVNFLSLLF
jgi:hypothetical protein